MDIQDVQLTKFVNSGNGRILTNAGKAKSYGIEAVSYTHLAKLSETIGFTAAAYYDHSDGFYTNAYDGKKIDKEDNVGGRFKLEGRFNPNFRASYSLSVDYTDQGAFPYGMFIGTGNTDHKYVNPININDPSSCLLYTSGRKSELQAN